MLRRLTKTPIKRRRERGLQLVETAIVMPVMILLLGSVAEFGRYFHMRSTMVRATMTGAVYMSDKPNTMAERLNASRMAACGQTADCNNATMLLYPGVTEANITTAVAGNVIIGQTVTVSTTGVTYQPVFGSRPVFSNGRVINPGSQWMSYPIRVQTSMRYAGS
jgi:Flp pilus assembly protein TadG